MRDNEQSSMIDVGGEISGPHSVVDLVRLREQRRLPDNSKVMYPEEDWSQATELRNSPNLLSRLHQLGARSNSDIALIGGMAVLTGPPGPWEYKAVPFTASTAPGADRAQAAASQFETLLSEMNEVGFEYLRMDHYSLMEAPGCLGALFGARVAVIPDDVAIFRRAFKD